MDVAAEARVVTVGVLLHQSVGQGTLAVLDELLQEFGDGEHLQLHPTSGLTGDELSDEIRRLHVVLPDVEGREVLVTRLKQPDDLIQDGLHVLLVHSGALSEAVGLPGTRLNSKT